MSSPRVGVLIFTGLAFFGMCAASLTADGQLATATLAAGSGIGSPGGQAAIPVTISATGAIDGFSFGLTQNASRLTALTAVLGPALALPGGIVPAFGSIQVNPGGSPGVIYGVVIDFFAVAQLPPAVVHTVAVVTYQIALLSPGGATPLTFTNTLSVPPSPPVEVFVVVGVDEIAPALTSGSVTVVLEQFIRGDVNLSGAVNLTDAVNLLYRIVGAAPQGTCAEADDIDGSGSVNIGDAIAILGHLYIGGPPPDAPYPSCGTATAPILGCLSSSNCP